MEGELAGKNSSMALRKGKPRQGRKVRRWLGLMVLGMGSVCAGSAGWLQEGSAFGNPQLLGQVAPSWSTQGWVNSPPLDTGQLRGKVVLLRFFNDNPPGAASLKEWFRAYRPQGFVVVGLYAPDPMPAETEREHVRQLASSLGFEFPVGLDSRWETLNRYWLEQPDAEMTAAAFLIDRKGMIRYIQPHGQYEKKSPNRAARREHEKLQAAIEKLLKETTEAPE